MTGTGCGGDHDLGARLDAAVDARRGELVELIADLVRARGELGDEERCQRIVAARLEAMGFAVERVRPDAEAALADPLAGYPPLSYEQRTCVLGRRAGGSGRTLHLSGHVDVVPVEQPQTWRHDPWGAEVVDGRMWGRGAGDMKAGLGAYLVAVAAALDVCDGELAGDLLFSSVIEEECGGNGMRAVLHEVGSEHALLIGEPTDLAMHRAGVGVIWFRLTARGSGAHAAFAQTRAPVDELVAAVGALRALEADLNAAGGDPLFSDAVEHPYNLNLGTLGGGSWPSSVPVEVALRGRIGFGRDLTPVQAQERVREAVSAVPGIEVSFDGFRARAYAHAADGPLAGAVAASHASVHGAPARVSIDTFTTDARHATGEALCYGPRAGAIHGTDEWVDLGTVHEVTRTIARVAAGWVA